MYWIQDTNLLDIHYELFGTLREIKDTAKDYNLDFSEPSEMIFKD